MSSYAVIIEELRSMQGRLRSIRDRTCVDKSAANDRYLALSGAVSGINKAINDMLAEEES